MGPCMKNRLKERKILVVDDEESIRKLFEMALKQRGYQVFSAASGEAALELLKNEEIPVMFLDLNLPGIDGIELCREIIEKAPDTIAYAITGFPASYKSTDYKGAGFKDYFSKPLSLETLYAAAENAFSMELAVS